MLVIGVRNGKERNHEVPKEYSAAVEDEITTHFCYHLLMVLRQQFPLCLCKEHEFRFHGASGTERFFRSEITSHYPREELNSTLAHPHCWGDLLRGNTFLIMSRSRSCGDVKPLSQRVRIPHSQLFPWLDIS